MVFKVVFYLSKTNISTYFMKNTHSLGSTKMGPDGAPFLGPHHTTPYTPHHLPKPKPTLVGLILISRCSHKLVLSFSSSHAGILQTCRNSEVRFYRSLIIFLPFLFFFWFPLIITHNDKLFYIYCSSPNGKRASQPVRRAIFYLKISTPMGWQSSPGKNAG